jgi:5'-deoxynucleotidase YfbR-like HD superfamily hydrolase
MITNRKGKVIDIFNIKDEDIIIEDIVLALPNICRYGGRIEYHMSVAQHAVELARWLTKQNKLHLVPHALLHDACEAYIGDIIYPIKIQIPKFLELEEEITNLVYKKYGVDASLHKYFDPYDKGIVINEMKALGIYEREKHLVTHVTALEGLEINLMSINEAREQYVIELRKYFGDKIFRN